MFYSKTNDIEVPSKLNITEFFDPEKVSYSFSLQWIKIFKLTDTNNYWC